MEVKKESKNSPVIKITLEENGNVLGRAFLYLLYNDQHAEPYGFAEDIFVDESVRGKGLGNQLLDLIIAEAKAQGCYKLLGTARHAKADVQDWYLRHGFKNWGLEFRMDFKP